jgi:translocation and assembly module TamB
LPPGGRGPRVVPEANRVYVIASDGTLRTLNVQTGGEVDPAINFLSPGARASGVITIDGVVYATTADTCGGNPNGVYALDLASKAVRLTANTSAENRLNFALVSDIAGSTIQGHGNAVLSPDYPVDAQLSFNNVTWSRMSGLLGYTNSGQPAFDAVTDGQVSFKGPAVSANQLNASLWLTRLSFTTLPRPGLGKPVTIQNQGTISVALDHGTVRLQNARLSGPQTDLQATGSMDVTGRNMNLALNGNADLGVIQNFNRDVYSSGKVVLATTVRGDVAKPLINGQIDVHNVTFSATGVPLGVSNANGAITFSGNTARITNLTAESGGGKLSLTGFASYSDVLRFALRTTASSVRVRVQQGVSLTGTADVRLAGTADQSNVTGNATIDRISYAPQSDVGSLLTRSAPPVQSPTTPNPLLDNMKLDIRVRSLPGMMVQTSMAENLQADADLHVRGTANQLGMTGRVTISEGKLNFFGSDYAVNTGTISFYNPLRIEPILDVSLETQARGVDVTLEVTGPIDNMKLSYTSDPPLQFQEIVALLASGKTPTSDPTLLANQPAAPEQGFQQMGESAILGQAVANPVASQLQRVFGVSQLKIDPSFTTGSNVPTAALAMQQQITSNLTFTYTSKIDDPNSMMVRTEWAFSPQWSAVATRDQNGIVSLNFFYKKGFR